MLSLEPRRSACLLRQSRQRWLLTGLMQRSSLPTGYKRPVSTACLRVLRAWAVLLLTIREEPADVKINIRKSFFCLPCLNPHPEYFILTPVPVGLASSRRDWVNPNSDAERVSSVLIPLIVPSAAFLRLPGPHGYMTCTCTWPQAFSMVFIYWWRWLWWWPLMTEPDLTWKTDNAGISMSFVTKQFRNLWSPVVTSPLIP